MKRLERASVFLRWALAATFLSAVSSRFGFWSESASGWQGFLAYTAEVNSFMPSALIPFLAISATALEITLSLMLIAGYKTRWAAFGAGILTLVFAIAMAISFGLKEPLDYSVFVDSAAAFVLAELPSYPWSLDNFLEHKSLTN